MCENIPVLQEHRLQLEAERHREALRIAEVDHAEALRHEQERQRAELAAKVAADESRLAFLSGLNSLGVNLTEYLVACAETRPDKVLKVTGPSASAAGAGGFNIHTNI